MEDFTIGCWDNRFSIRKNKNFGSYFILHIINLRHMNDMNLKKKLNYRRIILWFQRREGFIKNTKKHKWEKNDKVDCIKVKAFWMTKENKAKVRNLDKRFSTHICSKKLIFWYMKMGFPGGTVVKNPPANAGDSGLIPGLGRSSGEGNGNPL